MSQTANNLVEILCDGGQSFTVDLEEITLNIETSNFFWHNQGNAPFHFLSQGIVTLDEMNFSAS